MRYQTYKPADMPWTREIPSHWACHRGKRIFQNIKEKNLGNKERNVLSLTLNGVVRNDVDNPIGLAPKDYGTYQIFEPGDLVFKLIDLENISTSRVGIVPERGVMSSAYIRLVPRENVNIRYFYLQYFDLWLRNIYNGLGAGVRQTLSADDLLNLKIPVPPRDEEDQIVRYLDWKTSEINKLIHRYQAEIGLLREKEQNSICKLVLHGIGVHELCDSGDRFLGEMPTGWQCLRNKYIFRERSEYSETGKEVLLSVSKHYGVKKYSDLKEDEQYATIKPAETLVGYKKVKKNDLVMNIMRARNGSYGISQYDGIVSPAYAVYEPVQECNPVYLHYFMKTPQVVSMFEAYSYGIAEHRRRLYPQDFLRLFSFVPPLPEQNEIEEQATEIHEKYESLCRKIEKEIELLREYRTRLISDVVTGQIDVRNVEIPDYIPEQDEVTDALDETDIGEVDADAE